jgi:hypothetical protein
MIHSGLRARVSAPPARHNGKTGRTRAEARPGNPWALQAVLSDVSATARGVGIRWPVARTAAAWVKCVVIPAGVDCQDDAGRP